MGWMTSNLEAFLNQRYVFIKSTADISKGCFCCRNNLKMDIHILNFGRFLLHWLKFGPWLALQAFAGLGGKLSAKQ